MRVIIAGSRKLKDTRVVWDAVKESGFEITTVLSGGAIGADRAGEEWAKSHAIKYDIYWPQYGLFTPSTIRTAPLVRNQRMVQEADALIAIWDGKSRGTADVIRKARKRGLKVYVKVVK